MKLSKDQKKRLAIKIDLLTGITKGNVVTGMVHEILDELDFPEMTNKEIMVLIKKSNKEYGY